MKLLTPILRPFFVRRADLILVAHNDIESSQRSLLRSLIDTAKDTQWGRDHGYRKLTCYEDFAEAVDITPYDHIRPLVMRAIAGEKNILWPGAIRRFAQSSGTSDGKSKYIPVTDQGLNANHYFGASTAVANYLKLYPNSRIFDGKAFILGGSFANELHLDNSRAKVGDLSANLIDAINPIANFFRVPAKEIALMVDWKDKLPALVNAAKSANVTNISGVPSWFLVVLRQVLASTGAKEIHDVWPNLEVFFHGGIAFGPYRSQYAEIIDPSRMRYLETYNASEGFFAVQDTIESSAMLLLLNAGVFFEFIPVSGADRTPRPAWQLEVGRIYEMIISSVNGLWRYPLGDTVKVESIAPLRITIAGRTKHFINAFGEEVMVHNTDAALVNACRIHNCHVDNYTVAPVYTTDNTRGHHQWLIEFSRRPADIDAFARSLDQALADENSDYQAKRSGSIFLDPLTIVEARKGLFDDWLASTGRRGGQRKVPRLSNNREIIDSMLIFNNK